MKHIKFKLMKNKKVVGYETHTIDPDIGHIGIYHKALDSKMRVGYPITGGDKWYVFHDDKILLKIS